MSALVLFDTHAIVWSVAGDRRLGPETRMLLKRALATGIGAISAATSYELTWITARRQINLPAPPGRVLDDLAMAGMHILGIDDPIARDAATLDVDHGDPIDRLIAATAIRTTALLVTADEKLLESRLGLKTHDARL